MTAAEPAGFGPQGVPRRRPDPARLGRRLLLHRPGERRRLGGRADLRRSARGVAWPPSGRSITLLRVQVDGPRQSTRRHGRVGRHLSPWACAGGIGRPPPACGSAIEPSGWVAAMGASEGDMTATPPARGIVTTSRGPGGGCRSARLDRPGSAGIDLALPVPMEVGPVPTVVSSDELAGLRTRRRRGVDQRRRPRHDQGSPALRLR